MEDANSEYTHAALPKDTEPKKCVHRLSLWDDIPDELMVTLAVCFLVAVLRITIEYVAELLPGLRVKFYLRWIGEFAAAIDLISNSG